MHHLFNEPHTPDVRAPSFEALLPMAGAMMALGVMFFAFLFVV